MSDIDNEALNQMAEEENSQTSTPEVETKASEESVEADQSSSQDEPENTESDLHNDKNTSGKKGAENRIRELNARAKQAEERAQSLEEKMRELTQQAQYGNTGQGYQPLPVQPNEPLVRPGEELTVEELEGRLRQREAVMAQQLEARVNLRFEQNKVLQRIQDESTAVMQKYPELNPDRRESFDKDLSDSIVEATLAYTRSNPTGSVVAFVDKLMKPYSKSVKKQVATKTDEIVRQVADTAARPNQISKQEKPFKELSIKEMEEKLGMVS